MDGGCACGSVRYRMTDAPLIVHCCHCTWCQRETGSAFAVNALIERRALEVTGETAPVTLPSYSGKGQVVHRCPFCGTAVWSHYAGSGEAVAFVRAGTLDMPEGAPPDVHIYTTGKLDWVTLPPGAPAYPGYYDRAEVWPDAARDRLRLARASAAP